jgi:hypothetical protein
MSSRRLFDEPMLQGVTGQPSFSGIQLYHFEERRDYEVSLDRLGASGIDRKVSKYLLPRAQAATREFAKPKRFDGWYAVSAKELANACKGPGLAIHASPVNLPSNEQGSYIKVISSLISQAQGAQPFASISPSSTSCQQGTRLPSRNQYLHQRRRASLRLISMRWILQRHFSGLQKSYDRN